MATLRPRDMALALAGKQTDPKWESERRALREKVKEAAATQRKLQKERERAERKGASSSSGRSGADRDAARDARGGVQGAAGAVGGGGGVVLRPGVVVDPEEAEEVVDDDSLVMLARGVAYAGCGQVEPLVKKLYQQVGKTRMWSKCIKMNVNVYRIRGAYT